MRVILTISILLCLIISALSQEPYYQIYLSQEGIYKITGEELQDAGVNISTLDPKTIQIFSDGQKTLPYSTTEPLPVLKEISIIVNDGNDSTFNFDDNIIFYAQSLNRYEWDNSNEKYSYIKNPYDTLSCYWLRWNVEQGKRISQKNGDLLSSNAVNKNMYTDYLHLEKDVFNPYKSGLDWIWNIFKENNNFIHNFVLEGVAAETANIEGYFRVFEFYGNNFAGYYNVTFDLNGGTQSDIQFNRNKSFSGAFPVISGTNFLELNYSTSSAENAGIQAGLDWIDLEYSRSTFLANISKKIYFEKSDGIYQIKYDTVTTLHSISIFDITDAMNVRQIHTSDNYFFEDTLNNQHKMYYLQCNGYENSVLKIEPSSRDIFSSVAGANYIIITHQQFESELLSLKTHREVYNNFTVKIVTMDDIYNEFSFGRQDPTALRNFIKFTYDNWDPKPTYILLAGNGYYDYRNITKEYSNNWIPTFEISSNSEVNSRATDDYFVDLNLTNSNFYSIDPDLAIGRFPADNVSELTVLIQKTIDSELEFKPGLWRLSSLFIADDEFTPYSSSVFEFFHETESIIENNIPKEVRDYKLFLREYPFENNGKPAATYQLLNWINQGVRSIFFFGHASEYQLTHENLFNIARDKHSIHNYQNHSFYFGSSQLCKFDQLQDGIVQSLLKVDNKGFFAALVPNRLVYSSPSARLAEQFYTFIYDHNKSIGEALFISKDGSINSQKFILLGDPALNINLPPKTVAINEIVPDTLKARSLVSISGTITNSTPSDSLVIEVREPGKIIYATETYESTGRAIFRGLVPVNSGNFIAQFVVPNDVPHDSVNSRCRIYAYTWNNNSEGMGFKDSIKIGGLYSGAQDNTSPDLSLSIQNNKNYESATLLAEIYDENGINLSSLGNHQPMIFFDGNYNDTLFISEFFMYDENSYQSGKISYPLPFLEDGSHSARLIIHDNYNNSTVDSIEFTITGIEKPKDIIPTEITLSQNYPNPFNPETTIPVKISGEGLFKVKLDVFNILGQKVVTLFNGNLTSGNYSFKWSGKNNQNNLLPSGIYIYRLWGTNHAFDGAKNQRGKIFTQVKKMMFLK